MIAILDPLRADAVMVAKAMPPFWQYLFRREKKQGTALGGDFPGIVNSSRIPLEINASGHFSASAPITQGTYFRASGGTVLNYGIGCKPPSIAPKGCVSASLSGFAMPGPITRVTVPYRARAMDP
jgi:hypothetical protein